MFADMNGDGGVDPNPVNGEVLQVDHFYPFGLRMAGLSLVPAVKNSYLFTGKETQDELGLGWIDFGARMYDAASSRWNGVDVMAEKYLPISPFVYVGNSPMIFIDPNGEDIYIVIGGQVYTWDEFKHSGVESATKLKWALEDMQNTQLGRDTWNSLDKNGSVADENDVYITLTDKIMDAHAATLTNLRVEGQENSIFFTKDDRERTVFRFSSGGNWASLNGVAIQNEKKKIHVVAFSSESFDNRPSSSNAYTAFHELFAHILADPSGKKTETQEHIEFGLIAKYNEYGIFEKYEVKKDSNAYKFILQMLGIAKYSSDKNAMQNIIDNDVID